MRTRQILVAAAVGVVALIPATAASAATLRVVSDAKNVFGETATTVTSATSYIDSKGKTHKLAANTAMGQIVETGLPYTAVYDAGYNAAYLTRIVGAKAPATGYWAFYVNDAPSTLGATDAKLKTTDEVVWIVDNDYSNANGPFAYDLNTKVNGDGTVTFTAMRFGANKAIAAGGAPLLVNGVKAANFDAKGRLTLPLSTGWTAQIPAKGKIAPSEIVAG